MRSSSLFGLDNLEGPLWSMMPPEAKVVSLIHSAAPGHVNIQSLFCFLNIGVIFVALWGHLDISGLCRHLRSC